ncbi:hypothetical protein ACJX0J_009873, partial [Zea mays]
DAYLHIEYQIINDWYQIFFILAAQEQWLICISKVYNVEWHKPWMKNKSILCCGSIIIRTQDQINDMSFTIYPLNYYFVASINKKWLYNMHNFFLHMNSIM